MNTLFNQSILDVGDGAAIGRSSFTQNSSNVDESNTEVDLDFGSKETEASVRTDQVRQDMRTSSTVGKKGNAADVGLEDFDIKLQLGQGTFGRVYLAFLPQTGKKYAIKAIRKDVLIEYD